MAVCKWTTEEPTEAGWYWARSIYPVSNGDIECVLVQPCRNGKLWVEYAECDVPLTQFNLWYGPLEIPEIEE